MSRYILKRILGMIVILWCAGLVIFTLTYLVPGDPAALLLGKEASQETIEIKRHVMGLDKSFLGQLGTYMYNTFIRLDFGDSWVFSSSVIAELGVRLPRTLIVGLSAMVLNVVFGTLLGIFAGTHEGKWQDSLVMIIAMVFVSAPDFFVALLMILLFSLKLNWLPAYGIDSWQCYIMPILASSFGGIAINARQARSSMLEVIRADFVTTARSKGLPEHDVVYGHALPNALIPILTVVGMRFGSMLGGATIIEVIFSIPGIGQYLVNSINSLDYYACTGGIIFIAFTFAVIMLLTDLLYAYVDPRIKAQYAASGRKKVSKDG